MQMKKHIKPEVVNVTPAMAEQWLTKNTNNRNLRVDTAQRYAKDMREGRWTVSHQGLAFYTDGTLADGQHRLHAVIIYGKPVPFLVTRGVPRQAGQVIDQHAVRKTHDAIRIGGGAEWMERNAVAAARVVLSNMGTDVHTKSVAEIMNFMERYAEPLQFAQGLVSQKKRHLTGAPVVANYFCAERGGVARDKLVRFADIMLHGEISGPQENAAIRLREYLLQAGGGAWIGSARFESSKRIQRAIELFSKGHSIARLMMPDNLTYPIPK